MIKIFLMAVTANHGLDNFSSSQSLEKTFKRTISRLYELTSKIINNETRILQSSN